MRSYAFLDHDGPIAFAHRGGAGSRPRRGVERGLAGGAGTGLAAGLENSVAAFQRAIDLGYRYLETDVHATADGALLAFHDRTLRRVTDGTGRLARLTLADVRRARIGGLEQIPLLVELLEAYPDVRFNIDVKAARAVAPLVEVVRRTRVHDRVCIASFSDRRLALVRAALGPGVATAFGPRGVAALRVATRVSALRHLVRTDVPCVQIPMRVGAVRLVTPPLLELAHALGLHVHVWTIDDPGQMGELLDLGVDGIMTDEPERLRAVLVARGQWN